MNILFVEDRGSVSFYWKEMLESEGYTVYDAGNISQAIFYFREKQVDCLIIDLNLNPEGLKPEEIEGTHDGLLSGWIWLREYVYKEKRELKERTVILTEYMQQLHQHVSDEELVGIRLVEKGSIDPARQVLAFLKIIANEIQ
jgi:CheY-like chemotaxis protein